MGPESLGRWLVGLGVCLALVGALFWFGAGHFPIGRLPGDILWRKGNFTFYAPLGTSLLLSLLATLILTWLARR